MANHKEIVERVKAEAKDNDDLPTRTEVLREIKRTEIKDKALKREHEISLSSNKNIKNIVNVDCVSYIDKYKGSSIKLLHLLIYKGLVGAVRRSFFSRLGTYAFGTLLPPDAKRMVAPLQPFRKNME